MGHDCVNFLSAEPFGVVGTQNHSVQPNPFMWRPQTGGAAAAGKHRRDSRRRTGAAFGAESVTTDRRHSPSGVWDVVGRQGSRPGAASPSDIAMTELIGRCRRAGRGGPPVDERRPPKLKPVLLELGGKNALIAFRTTSLRAVSAAVVDGMNCTWCGQSCGRPAGFLHESIYEAVIERERRSRCKRLQAGPSHRSGDHDGLHHQQIHTIASWDTSRPAKPMARASSQGGAGRMIRASQGMFIETTSLRTSHWLCARQEEIFGPVFPCQGTDGTRAGAG